MLGGKKDEKKEDSSKKDSLSSPFALTVEETSTVEEVIVKESTSTSITMGKPITLEKTESSVTVDLQKASVSKPGSTQNIAMAKELSDITFLKAKRFKNFDTISNYSINHYVHCALSTD